MSVERDPSAETHLREGRQHYDSKRYKQALESFTRAMKRCPCTRKMKRERCGCKNFEEVAARNGSIFDEAMYQCKCEVGKTFNKCDSLLHVQALDYRAATFEALKELDRARKDAEWILELAPRLPDGYLRLGKISRLQKKHEYAWKLYNAGIEANSSNEVKTQPKVQRLYAARRPLHARFFRQDPLQLPLDLVQIIFSHLDLPTLVRCVGVSKVWRCSLTSEANRIFWRNLRFPRSTNQRSPSTTCLAKLVRYSGTDIRQIAILDAARFRLSQNKFQILLGGGKRLERLEIHGHFEGLDASRLPALPFLTQLVLGNCEPPRALMSHIADSLENLHMKMSGLAMGGPVMPRLKYLRLEAPDLQRAMLHDITLKIPNIKQLCVTNVAFSIQAPLTLADLSALDKLEVFIALGVNFDDRRSFSGISLLMSRNRGRNLRHIQVESTKVLENSGAFWLNPLPEIRNWLAQSNSEGPTNALPNTFDSLESLRLKNIVLDAIVAQEMLRSPISSSRFHNLDVAFPQASLNETEGVASCQRLEQFEWLRGESSIRSIGLSNFRFRRYPKNATEYPLPNFLASLPNLETLEINSEHYDDAELCVAIVEILQVTHLKTLYQSTIKGMNLDKLRVFAEKAGVKLIWGERPLVWPVPLIDS